MSLSKLSLLVYLVLLTKVAHAGSACSSFAFGPNNSWVIVHENRSSWGFHGLRVPRGLGEKIEELAESETILGIGMNETAWIVIGSKNWYSNNLPADLDEHLRERVRQGHQILDVALTRNNNWVVLSRRNGRHYWHSSGGDVPQGLVDYLRDVTNKNHRVLGVGISLNGGWAASYRTSNSVKYRMWGVATDAVEFTNELDNR